MLKFIFLGLLCFSNIVAAEEGHKEGEDHHEEEAKLPGGILSFDDGKSEFALKPNVVKNFELHFQRLVSLNGVYKVPASSIVRSLKATTIYVRKNDVFKNVPVTIFRSDIGFVTFKSLLDLQGFEVVTSGSNFLKTIHQSLEEGPSEGHGH